MRKSSLVFAVEARLPITPGSSAASLTESTRKDLPKTTTLDLIQLFIALRHEEDVASRENPVRHRHLQLLHSFLRDNLPAYRINCCIVKGANTTVFIDFSLGAFDIFVRGYYRVFVERNTVGMGRAQRRHVARVYELAGVCCLSMVGTCGPDKQTERYLAGLQPASELGSVLQEILKTIGVAFRNENPLDEAWNAITPSLDTFSAIQLLFDVGGVQMIDNERLSCAFANFLCQIALPSN